MLREVVLCSKWIFLKTAPSKGYQQCQNLSGWCKLNRIIVSYGSISFASLLTTPCTSIFLGSFFGWGMAVMVLAVHCWSMDKKWTLCLGKNLITLLSKETAHPPHTMGLPRANASSLHPTASLGNVGLLCARLVSDAWDVSLAKQISLLMEFKMNFSQGEFQLFDNSV